LVLDIEGQRLSIKASTALEPGNAVKAMVRPEAIGIGPAGGGLTATVVTVTYLGDKVEYVVRVASQSLHIVRFNPPESERFAPGSAVTINLPSDGVQLLPRD
jgi:putative spermidine/putrescine transport system ATP-binding protein